MSRLAGLLITIISIAGCSSHGAYVEADRVEEVRASVKTAKELSDALGTPSVTIPMGDGTTMWVYEGVFSSPDAISYVPYISLFAGRNNQKCSRLTAIVNNESGVVSDIQYETAKDSDYWAKADDTCRDEKKKKEENVENVEKVEKQEPAATP
jgi:outer membrane protein assembly factor BamE (lipoprotein component of BamABCDE complex)